jgi:16S rRNA (guanine527-N7)-methyltransferase
MGYATETNGRKRKRPRRDESAPMTAEAFRALTGISDAGLERLRWYLTELERWQPKINLVGPATLQDPWRRHFLDSAQLAPLLPAGAARLIDVGSGAGFPALVVAVLAADAAGEAFRGLQVTAIESDQRKATFLNEIIRLLEIPATVYQGRAEAYGGARADVVTARACAPLERLLGLAAPLAAPGASLLFPKGEDVARELTAAGKDWKMHCRQHPSLTDPRGAILEITDIARRDEA